MKNTYESITDQFSSLRILVIGDVMLDTYLKGTTNRLCREAPVPIVDLQNRIYAPGGAANTAVNIRTLGGDTVLISVIGSDDEGKALLQSLQMHNIPTEMIVVDTNRQTMAKQRIMADDQLLVRYDFGSTQFVEDEIEVELINKLINIYPTVDAVIISDYGYGIITKTVLHTIRRLQRQYPRVLMLDSKHIARYKGMRLTAVKPNYQEAINLLHLPPLKEGERLGQIKQYGEKMLDIMDCDIAAITVDTEGGMTFERGKEPYRTYTKPVKNSKAAGAGDTYVAAMTLALAAEAPMPEASEIAASAATVVVQKEGTSTCTLAELQNFFLQDQKNLDNPVHIQQIIDLYHEQGKKIVFTNGCFDILHRGHITYLNKAKALGDILVLGVNADASIKRLKGTDRPINNLKDRMAVLAALSSVDYVIPFTEDTPINLIKSIKPDIYVKGGDYTLESLPEAKIIQKLGGRVELLPYIKDKSTTNIIKRIRSQDTTKEISSNNIQNGGFIS